ncbi:MAG: TetR/AcrR family transcriptional regulator [Candidatus Sedimenticola sp. PURPLELP]
MKLGSIDKKLSARERILRTAHNLFYRDGIRATGIDRIIEEAGVTKVTLYRHFPSKNELIKVYLEYRHELWMNWFVDALERHSINNSSIIDILVATLGEWFESDGYRGCAFINAVVEMDGVLPEFTEISKRHKEDVIEVITDLLPKSKVRSQQAQAVAIAMDGAIFRAQLEKSPDHALESIKLILQAII